MKPIIGIMGTGSGEISEKQKKLAERLGELIAKSNSTLLTGAGLGLPYIASKSAKKHNGNTIGISPAKNLEDHKKLGLKTDAFSNLVFTGLGFIRRNIINIHKSDILIFIGGEHGTLNEFTIAYAEEKIIGILDKSGGITDLLEKIIKTFTRKKNRRNIIIDSNPERLVKKALKTYKNSR